MTLNNIFSVAPRECKAINVNYNKPPPPSGQSFPRDSILGQVQILPLVIALRLTAMQTGTYTFEILEPGYYDATASSFSPRIKFFDTYYNLQSRPHNMTPIIFTTTFHRPNLLH